MEKLCCVTFCMNDASGTVPRGPMMHGHIVTSEKLTGVEVTITYDLNVINH